MPQDPFAEFRAQAPSAPIASASASTDPFAEFRPAPALAAASAPATTPTFAPQKTANDPFAEFRSEGINNPTTKTGTSPENEPEEAATWYGKTWDWLNKPMLDLHRAGAGGFESGVEDVLSGLTSPLSAGLALGTLGTGPLLEALGIGARELPVALQAARSLVDAGFTVQQVHGLVQQSPQFLDALKYGDYETAKRLGVNMLAGGAFAALGTRSAFREFGALGEKTGLLKPNENLAAARKEFGEYQLDVEKAEAQRRSLKETALKGLEHPELLPGPPEPALKADDEVFKQPDAAAQEGRAKAPAPQPQPEEAKNWKADALKPGEKTLDAYKDDTAREEYRTKVADQFQANVIDKAPEVPEGKKPIAHLFLGGTASGKSSLTNKILEGNPGIISVNPDEAKLQIPEYEQLKQTDPKNAAARVHNEAGLIADDILNRTVASGKDFLYDSTTSGGDADALIKDLQSKGYRVDLQAVHIPTDEALVREGARAAVSDDPVNRGRRTPREKILANHKGAVENWTRLKEVADESHLYDNTGKTPREVYSLVDGKETWHTEDAKDVHEAFLAKANGSEKRLLKTDEEIDNAVNQRIQEIQTSRAGVGTTRATDAGGDGAVQGEMARTVREGAAGARPAGGSESAPDDAAHQVAARGGETAEGLGRQAKSRLLGAIFRWVDTGGNKERISQQIEALKASSAFKKNYSAKEQAEILARYDLARKLTPAQLDFANRVRQNLEQDLELSYQHGLVRTAHENYITHIWGEEPSSNEPVNTRKFQSNSGQFDTNVSFAKRRTFGSAFDGEVLGYKLKTDDPVELMANYRYKTAKAIAARDFMERLYDKGLRLPDGRAMVAGTGTGTTIHDDEKPSTFVDPKRGRATRISSKLTAEMEENGELHDHLMKGTVRQLAMESVRLPDDVQEQLRKNPQELQDRLQSGELKKAPGEDGEIFGVRPVYGWETGDYKAIDHPAFRDWFFATNAADNSPVFVKGDLRVHPDAAEFLKRAVGADRSPIRDLRIGDVAVGKKLLNLSSQAKHLTLSLSPFHLVQEGLRAVMTGINPFGKLDFDLENDSALQQGVVHGLTLLRHPGELESYQEGVSSHSAVINKIPGLRQAQGGLQHFLFDKYIPGLKSRAYKSLYERYRGAYPEMSATEAATNAAAHTNEVFGGLNYAQMGRSLASQDAARMALLAPDWLESEVRSLHRAIDPKRGAIMRQDLARISLFTFAAARVLNLLTTGQAHPEAPFGVVLPGQKGEDDKVFSFRTLPVDLVHAMSDPRQFIAGRVNPLTVRPTIEGITGRDYFGRKVTPGQEVRDFASNIVPIATQIPAKKMLNIQDVSNPEMVARMAGMSVNRYRTEAEKLAQEKASDRMPSGLVTDQELANHQRNIRLEDMLRNGNVTPAQLRQQLPRTTAQGIIDGANLTPLQSRFKRLPLPDALEVWDMALPREKEELIGEMRAKRTAYLKSHHAQERAADPAWRKLQAVFGQ